MSAGSFARRHHFNSWLSSVISIPAITMNLQLSISRGSSSSGSWQLTRQYWHSWFQQNLPYGIVSGLMNWKQRSREFRSGTWNFLPWIVISTSFSYGRKGSDIISAVLLRRPLLRGTRPQHRRALHDDSPRINLASGRYNAGSGQRYECATGCRRGGETKS